MKKTILIIIAALVTVALMLSGCGDKGGAEGKVISPLPGTVDIENLENCIISASLEEGDVFSEEDGTVKMKVTVYDFDLYDMVDMSQLKVGDILAGTDENVKVSELETDENGCVIINGGLDVGGIELCTDENTVYYKRGYNDAKDYYEIGEVILKVSEDFIFTDASDLDSEPVEYSAQDLAFGKDGLKYFFIPHNTSIVVAGGKVAEMNRRYVP